MPKPNRDLEVAGWSLQNTISVNHTSALERLVRELAAVDGYGSGAPEVAVRSSADLTGPERHADARLEYLAMIDEVKTKGTAVLVAIRELNDAHTRAQALRAPKVIVNARDKQGLCCSNQAGKHAVVEWGDALCMDNGDSARGGLCDKHWWRWYRARKRDGIDVSKEFQPL